MITNYHQKLSLSNYLY